MGDGGRRFRRTALVRDAWLVAGVTFLLFLALEIAYRGQGAVRRARRAEAAAAAHPDADQPWFVEVSTIATRAGGDFDPYRAWRPRPIASRWVNTDADGNRVTVQPASAGGRPRRIVTLGDSAMWGWSMPDSATIPSALARELRRRGFDDIEVINRAQPAYNLTQGVISLVTATANGDVPDLVVFLDGANEISTAWTTGRAGDIWNRAQAERAWQLGRRGFFEELGGLGRHSALVQRLRSALGAPDWRERARPSVEVCRNVAAHAAQMARAASATAREFGFDVAFFFQPIRATTRKRLTAQEPAGPDLEAYRTFARACTTATDQAMVTAGVPYWPLHDLFDQDTTTVYTDDWGHLTSRGYANVANAIADAITPLLSDAPAARSARRAPQHQ